MHPGAIELCDGIDNDCLNGPDDGLDPSTYWADTDGDGYGDPNEPHTGCEQPSGTVDNDEDCDDTDGSISPDAIDEPDDGIDADCDGVDPHDPFVAHVGTFIAPDGDDSNDCSQSAPCLTIGRASSEAVGLGVDTVYAAGGTYSNTSRGAVQVNVQGGLHPETWAIEPETSPSTFEYTANNQSVVYTSGSVNVELRDLNFTTVGSGIDNRSASTLLLERVTVHAGSGPALDLRHGGHTTRVQDSTLTNNSGTTIDLTSGGVLKVTDSTLHNQNTSSTLTAISSNNSAQLTVSNTVIRSPIGLNISGGTAELSGLEIHAATIGAALGGASQVRLRGSTVDVCESGETSPHDCEGLWLNGPDTLVDSTRIRVHQNNSTDNFGVRFLGNGGKLVDSVVEVGPTPNDDTIALAAGGAEMVVANSFIQLADGSRRSWLVRHTGSNTHLVLVNSILDPGTVQSGGGDALSIVSTTGSVTLHHNQLEHAPPNLGLYVSSPYVTLDWSQVDTCSSWSPPCASAGGNSEGSAGLHDPAGGDYRLNDSAVCIDGGTDISAWIPSPERATDLLGTPRDGTPDCGPTEWVSGQF